MPDVFVPADTQRASDYYIALRSKNLLNKFVLGILDTEREAYLKQYPDFKAFNRGFEPDDAFMEKFYAYAEEKGVPHTNFKAAQAQKFLQEMFRECSPTPCFPSRRPTGNIWKECFGTRPG